MDGVTVVEHVLLRRLLSILRDKDTPHRVFRETMTDAALILGYESMRGLRGAEISVETPLETTSGVRLADEVFVVAILRAGLGLGDGFLRLRAARGGGAGGRVPAARARGAGRASRDVPRRGGPAAGRVLREHPVRGRGRRG